MNVLIKMRRRRRRFGGFRAQSGAANGAVRVGLGPRDDTLVVEHVLARRDGDLLAALEVLEVRPRYGDAAARAHA